MRADWINLIIAAARDLLQILDFTLDFVQHLHVTQGLLSQRAFVGRMQFKELAPGMGHAADFSHAQFKAGLVATETIAD